MGGPSAAALAVLESEDEHQDAEYYSEDDGSGGDVYFGGDEQPPEEAIGEGGPTEEQVEQMFKALDADWSGKLERDEVAALAEQLGQGMGDEAIDAAMKEMDDDGSGGIDMPGFKLWFIKQFGIADGDEDEEHADMPLFDVREGIVGIYNARLGKAHAERKLESLDELMDGWAGKEAALLRNIEAKYAIKSGEHLKSDSIERLTAKALAARAERDRVRATVRVSVTFWSLCRSLEANLFWSNLAQVAEMTERPEISMRVRSDKVKFRIVSTDDIEAKKEREVEKQANFYETMMANRIQIEWRMAVKRSVRRRIHATTSIAASYRGWRVRSRMMGQLGAMVIQRAWRRYHTRRHAVLLELYEIAVRYIQRRVRWRQARHRARKTLLAKQAVKACWVRQTRRQKEIKAMRREQAKLDEVVRKKNFTLL